MSAPPPIRDLADADVDRALEINAVNVPEVGAADLERLRFIIAESAIALVVEDIERPGTAVGFALVLAPNSAYDSLNYRWFMDRYDDAFYLDRVAFDPAFQGRGLGSALYAAVADRLVAGGRDGSAPGRLGLEVNVDPPNEASLAFHAKHGFVEVGRRTSKGIEVSLMTKTYDRRPVPGTA